MWAYKARHRLHYKISEINWQDGCFANQPIFDLPSTAIVWMNFAEIYGTIGNWKIKCAFIIEKFSDVVLRNDNLFCLSTCLLVAHFVVTNLLCTEYDLLASSWNGKQNSNFENFGTLRSCLRLELLTRQQLIDSKLFLATELDKLPQRTTECRQLHSPIHTHWRYDVHNRRPVPDLRDSTRYL